MSRNCQVISPVETNGYLPNWVDCHTPMVKNLTTIAYEVAPYLLMFTPLICAITINFLFELVKL